MFTKLEQHSQIKIEEAHGHSTQKYFQGLHEAHGNAVLHIIQWHNGLKCSRKVGMPFRTTSIQDNPTWRTTQFNFLLLRWMSWWTACELAAEVGVWHKTVLHILHDILGCRKFSACWIPREISGLKQWHCNAVAQALLDRYQREGDN